ncbi:MAG: glycyl-radical enzyme activating protein [Oscillospiraceae bacterium]|jgi:pyruvate formate lyase activating enzyme|nr:glycyl-radical enzyme activating protein [Oscillospiraceae bacterium]
MTTGMVLSIERCSLHDGPGLRTTVFLKGCPLSCKWCHNPESQSFKPQLYTLNEQCANCGFCETVCINHTSVKLNINEGCAVRNIDRENCAACGKCANACSKSALEIKGISMTAQEVMDVVLKDIRYYEQSGGGFTISGGEPLAQYSFTQEILKLAKKNEIHTCIETSGYTDTDRILSIIPYVDLFLYDFKESDDNKHTEFTGVSNSLIIKNLHAIDKAGGKIILRCPIIPGCNDRDDHFAAIADTAESLCNIIEINIMPYHPMGSSKSKRIGRDYPLTNIGFPADEQVESWIKAVAQATSVATRKG